MKITDLLKAEGVRLGVAAQTQDEAINDLVDLQVGCGNIADRDAYKKAVLAREADYSTAVGDGIAIPHAKTSAVKRAGLVAMTLKEGVDWKAPDGKPSDLLFLIAAPDTEANVHLEVLAKLSAMLMHEEFAAALRATKTVDEFLGVIDKTEAEHDAKEAAKQQAQQQKEAAAAQAAAGQVVADAVKYGMPQVLAITACPTGIAHTYMAAENLEKAADGMGITIKVETQGSVGAKNVLTADEIAACQGVIIAADKNVEMGRFDGKPVYSTSVSAGISDPEGLIKKITEGEAPVYHAAGGAAAPAASDEEGEGVWHVIYKHLMNGVSHMLPFVVGGGILMAISYLLDQPGMGTSSYGTSTPVAAFFNLVGNQAFNFMLPILAGYISMSIADRPGLAPGFVGGWIAKQGYTLGYLATAMDADAQGALISGGFIAALFAGFAAGYITLGIEKLCDHLPSSLEGIKPVLLYPLLAILIIGLVMLALNPLFAWINQALTNALNSMGTTNLVLVGAIVGGMMSVDMGGPFNKAAYVFGTAMLAEGTDSGQVIMASVMVGGMIPPLAIALSTTFFKNRWSEADRKAGVVNYIMGLSFITEGAIPYAAADPGRVLPSCIVGSALAGAISAGFGCTSPAPHGGAWVIAVIGNPVMYLVALVAGAIVAALILSFLKKPLPPEETGLAK